MARSPKGNESRQQKAARTKRLSRGEAAPAPKLRHRPGKRTEETTITAKQKLANVFDTLGGEAAMVRWAKKNPTEFYRLWARLIPKEENINVSQLGVEDMLAQLDSQTAHSGETLSVVESAAASLGLPPPSLAQLAEVAEDGYE